MFPFFMRIKVSETNKSGVNLYIPLIFLYILILPIVILILPIWLLYCLFHGGTEKGERAVHLPSALYDFICASKGTEINVNDDESIVILKIM